MRLGRGRVLAVLLSIATGAAVLWLSLGLREGVHWKLWTLVQQTGANVFRVYCRADKGFTEKDLDTIRALGTVADVAADTAVFISRRSTDEYSLPFTAVTPGYFQVRNLPLAAG